MVWQIFRQRLYLFSRIWKAFSRVYNPHETFQIHLIGLNTKNITQHFKQAHPAIRKLHYDAQRSVAVVKLSKPLAWLSCVRLRDMPDF